ncbi:unnamed protein product [Sphagnum compactum]
MACDKDESMDVDRKEANVDENEMDVHNVFQGEGRRRRLTAAASDGGRWVACTIAVGGGGGCLPRSHSYRNPSGCHWERGGSSSRAGGLDRLRYWDDPAILNKLGQAMGGGISGEASLPVERDLACEEDGEENVGEEQENELTVHHAVSIGDEEGLKILLQEGADKDERDEEGHTGLHFASGYGEVSFLRRLTDELHSPVYALVKGDRHGLDVLSVHRFCSRVHTFQSLHKIIDMVT